MQSPYSKCFGVWAGRSRFGRDDDGPVKENGGDPDCGRRLRKVILEVETFAWASWFNTERLQGELGELTPAETEHAYYAANPQPRAA
jgi:hypothetical protein